MKRLLLIALSPALLSSLALAQDSDWTLGSGTLPAPAGASDTLPAVTETIDSYAARPGL